MQQPEAVLSHGDKIRAYWATKTPEERRAQTKRARDARAGRTEESAAINTVLQTIKKKPPAPEIVVAPPNPPPTIVAAPDEELPIETAPLISFLNAELARRRTDTSYDMRLSARERRDKMQELSREYNTMMRAVFVDPEARRNVQARIDHWKEKGISVPTIAAAREDREDTTVGQPALAYNFRTVFSGGASAHKVEFQCATCSHILSMNWNGPNNPAAIAKKAEQQGWRVDKNVARLCRCPDCIQRERQRNRPAPEPTVLKTKLTEAMQKPMLQNAPQPTPAAPPVAPPLAPAANTPSSQADKAAKAITSAFADPTKDQKGLIRMALGEYFDEDAGRYKRGSAYTDQRIADEAGVAVEHVIKMREVSYGPLKGDDDLDVLAGRIAELERQLGVLKGDAKAMGRRLGVSVMTI